eukprot:600308-Rhodomonas_salina.3
MANATANTTANNTRLAVLGQKRLRQEQCCSLYCATKRSPKMLCAVRIEITKQFYKQFKTVAHNPGGRIAAVGAYNIFTCSLAGNLCPRKSSPSAESGVKEQGSSPSAGLLLLPLNPKLLSSCTGEALCG